MSIDSAAHLLAGSARRRRQFASFPLLVFLALAGCDSSSENGRESAAGQYEVTLGNAGGSLTSTDSVLRLEIPAGAVGEETRFTARAATSYPQDDHVVPGTVFQIDSEAVTLSKAAILTLRYDPASLPKSVAEADLAIHRATDGSWTRLETSTVEPADRSVRAELTGFGLHGLRATVDVEEGNAAAFIGGRIELLCEGVIALCKGKRGSCLLAEDSYLSGTFPGSRSFVVETTAADSTIDVLLFLNPETKPRSPGTDTDLFWYEPGCAEVYHYELSKAAPGQNLFEVAGAENQLTFSQQVVEAGQHLIEVSSDASSEYLLRVEVR